MAKLGERAIIALYRGMQRAVSGSDDWDSNASETQKMRYRLWVLERLTPEAAALCLSEEELLRLEFCGRKTVREIREWLESEGFELQKRATPTTA